MFSPPSAPADVVSPLAAEDSLLAAAAAAAKEKPVPPSELLPKVKPDVVVLPNALVAKEDFVLERGEAEAVVTVLLPNIADVAPLPLGELVSVVELVALPPNTEGFPTPYRIKTIIPHFSIAN